MLVVGGMDTGRKPGGWRMSENSSWLSDDAASSSSEHISTTAGWRDVMCVRRAYAYSPPRGWILVSIFVVPFAELGQGGSQVLIVWSLLLRRL